MTDEQYAVVERMGEDYHIILADPAPDGAVILTPATFCPACRGDGIDPDSYDKPRFDPCSRCRGRGGIPVTHPPTTVLPCGEVQ